MELIQVINNIISYNADGKFSLIAGDRLKIEVGEDEMDEVVPAGKKWNVEISVSVKEVDE